MLKNLRLERWWLVGGFLLIGLVVYLSLANFDSEPSVQGTDKVGHLLAYGTLMLWFCGVVVTRGHLRVAIGLTALGIALEIAQSFSGYRELSLLDVVANVVGIALGWLAAKLGFAQWCAWIEDRLGLTGV